MPDFDKPKPKLIKISQSNYDKLNTIKKSLKKKKIVPRISFDSVIDEILKDTLL